MAKQTGIHGLRGKVNGMSYYSSKNGGSLVRKINEGLGQRVKSSREYSNTRKNNAEFGMCGDFAGSIIKAVTLKWRFILISIATGLMVKKMKELVLLDTLSAWGQRIIKTEFFGVIRDAFNSLSKNEMEEGIKNVLLEGVTYNSTSHEIEVNTTPSLSEERVSELLAEGVNYFYTKVFALVAKEPHFDAAAGVYTKAETTLIPIPAMSDEDDLIAGEGIEVFDASTGALTTSPIDAVNILGGLLVVFMPARKVGTSISILQEKCSAYLAPVVAAE